jgi:hypothetical protein
MGINPRDIGIQLNKLVDGYKNRGTAIARTEVVRAFNEGALDGYENMGVPAIGVMVEWTTSGLGHTALGNPSPCKKCAPLSGLVLKIEEARGLLPRHPNAVFAGGTFVPYGQLLELVRARYIGPAVHILAGSHRITIGPNHPILTSRGFVKAAELNEGDKILYDDFGHLSGSPTSKIDLKQVPLIEDVFSSLLSFRGNTFISSSASDLHGDRVFCQGEVEAIRPTRFLMPVFNVEGIEQLGKLFLSRADTQSELTSSVSSSFFGGYRVNLPSSSGMSGSDTWVTADDRFSWLTVHNISFEEFEGYAFDASIASSLYCYNGLVVKNCMCAFVPANVGEKTTGQIRDAERIRKAIAASAQGDKRWMGGKKKISSKRPEVVTI